MKITMGSNYFFKNYEDFKPHDVDYIELTNSPQVKKMLNIRGQGKDYFIFKQKPKEELIADALESTLPMCVGKFLIKEFNDKIGFTIDDLPQVKPLIDKLDKKHEYEKIIYEAYLENGEFKLTENQRNAAYEKYKEARQNNENK